MRRRRGATKPGVVAAQSILVIVWHVLAVKHPAQTSAERIVARGLP
jgi:hypothetical protein